MKKGLLMFTTVFSVAVLTQSCDKIKDKIFDAFTAQGADVNFTVPPIADTTTMGTLGSQTVYFNLDSTVQAVTDDAFSLEDVNSVTADEITLTINNPDSANNMSNFESGSISFYSNTNTTPVVYNFTVPDQYATTFSVPVNNTNLKPYMTGNNFTYTINGKLRRPTTKSLDVNANIKFDVDN